MESQKTQGWWWPPNSRKAHYFIATDGGRSLCNGYLSFIPSVIASEMEDSDDLSPDNCAKCKKLVATRRKNTEKLGLSKVTI